MQGKIVCLRFGKKVKSRGNNTAAPADMIDGVSSSRDIAKLFAERLSSITESDTNFTASDTIVTNADTNVIEDNLRYAGLSNCPTVISVRDLHEAFS